MLSVKRLATTYMMPCQNYLLQLWVRTKLDESPYPLIGHEIPLVIKVTAILRYCICFHHILFSSKWSQTIYIGFYHILLFFSCIGWDRRSTTRTKRLMTSTDRAAGDLYCLITQNPVTYLFGRIWQFLKLFLCRCSFILRRVGQVSSFSGGEGAGSQKKKLKKVKQKFRKVWAERNPS